MNESMEYGYTLADLYEKAQDGGLTDIQERLARTWTYLDEDLPGEEALRERDDAYREFVGYIRRHRASYAASDVRRYDFRGALPEDVVRFSDIPYREDADRCRAHRLDVFLPKSAYLRGDADIPTIFNIHGGAFFYSFKEIQNAYAAGLAQRGFAVVVPNYTLAPGGDVLTMLEDVNGALGWLRGQGARYQLSDEQLFLACDSAGALLGLLLLAAETNAEVASRLGVESFGTAFQSVGFVSGMLVYDHLFDRTKPDASGMLDILRPAFLRLVERFEGSAFDTSEGLLSSITVPPTWLSTSTDDFLETDTLLTAVALRRMNRDHELVDWRAVNGRRKPHDYPLMTWDPESALANDSMAAFFREHMRVRRSLSASV